jgi:sucrose-6-phosphate hydrolase SacC (GH32 family)
VVVHGNDGLEGDRVTLTVDGNTRTMTLDRSASGALDLHPSFRSLARAPLLGGEVTVLRVVVDGSVMEVYVDDGLVTLTEQVFPRKPLTKVTVLPG